MDKKQHIRLTESDLFKMITEAVNSILNEVGETNAGQEKLARLAARKAVNGNRDYFDVSDYAKEKRKGDVNKQDLYAKAFHKEKDRLKNA